MSSEEADDDDDEEKKKRRDDEEDDDDNNNSGVVSSSTLAVLDPAALCGTIIARVEQQTESNRRGIIIPSMTSPNTIEKTTVG